MGRGGVREGKLKRGIVGEGTEGGKTQWREGGRGEEGREGGKGEGGMEGGGERRQGWSSEGGRGEGGMEE